MMTFSTLSKSDCDVEGCDGFGFPECQFMAVGLDLKRAIELGDSWRRGEWLPDVGHPEADNLSNRLNQMTNRRDALDK
jgi:hypothetical protein